jgi:hypothetical protein
MPPGGEIAHLEAPKRGDLSVEANLVAASTWIQRQFSEVHG